MAGLFVQYLAIYISQNSPYCIKVAKEDFDFFQTLNNKLCKFDQGF